MKSDGGRWAEQGSVTVEFALILPFVFLVLLAVLQAGLTARAQLLVAQAAREGARQATTADNNGEIIQAAHLAAGGLDNSALNISYSAPEGWQAGNPVTVQATYDMPCLFPGLSRIWPSALTLRGSTTMRIEKDR